LGGDEILADFILNAFYADRDIEEITRELVNKYIKLDNIPQKLSYDINNDKKSIATDIEEGIKDTEKDIETVEDNIEKEADDFYEEARNVAHDVESTVNAVISTG
jgi:BMFP domain-containing protein YqiC